MTSSALPTHEMKIYVSLKGFSVINVVAYSLAKCLYALFSFFFFIQNVLLPNIVQSLIDAMRTFRNFYNNVIS